MSDRERKRLREIHTFPALVKYLREDLGWPVEQDSFADLDLDDLTFDWDPEELGIDPKQAAKIEYVKQLRPLENGQPQGVFFVKFDTNSLPVVALRKLLASLVIKKRATAKAADRPLWAMQDLVFISSYGESEERQLSFAYFQEPEFKEERPALKVLGWDEKDTPLHLDAVHDRLHAHLSWPADPKALPTWRRGWSVAFREGHGETVRTAKDLAEELARLARGIRERAKQLLRLETEKGPLRSLMTAFKKALIHDLTDEQFADMYAQTIAYGLLSARITHPDPVKAETLPDLIPVTNPFLKELMETFVLAGGKHRGKKKAHQIDFDELGINDVVSLLRRANMDAVLRNFGADDRREDPVTYFYEDFLNAYDKQERKRRGVYYTPKPVVSYIVRSVHQLLQTEFGIEDGLASTITWGEMAKRHKDLKIPDGTSPASPFVQILDPATGTATFLVTVIEVIHETLTEKWKKAGFPEAKRVEAWNEYVPTHLLRRLYGYELMMAPYAIAHLKIGLKLFETGYRFESDERARVYLTNALEPASDASDSQIDALSGALANEAHAVNEVKRTALFTSVIGNPPYSKLSQNRGEWIHSLMERFKKTIKTGEIQRQALSNDYVKFFCLATETLAPSGRYVLGMITDNSYLDGPLFRDMRSDLQQCYRRIRITDLGGNSRKESPTATDENVFDIQQGVAVFLGSTFDQAKRLVSLAVVRGSRAEKASWLSLHTSETASQLELSPAAAQYYFVPTTADDTDTWDSWRPLPEIFAGGIRRGRPLPFNGAALATRHDTLAIAFTRSELQANLRIFFDRSESHGSLNRRFHLCTSSHFNFERARRDVTLADAEASIRPILYRPFDFRYVVYHPLLIGEPRPEVMQHLLAGSLALLSTRRVTGKPYDNALVCRGLAEYKAATHDRNTQVFPLYLTGGTDDGLLLATDSGSRQHLNIAPVLRAEWERNLDIKTGEDLFFTVYALLYSVEYRRRYQEGLERDYARIPRPSSPALRRLLTGLGATLVSLHLMEAPRLDSFITNYTGPKSPKVDRVGWSNDTVWLDAVATAKGQSSKPGTVGFRGVPEDVWNFHIGGYQVCEKWLKDRKGRRLLKVDIEHYQKIVVAISETIRIMREIDEVIEKHGGWPGAFQGPPKIAAATQ